MIQMHNVSSSNVDAVGYDENTNSLYVRFLHGGTYVYYGVPKFHYDNLLSASSVGGYLDAHIKKGGYSYRRV
ncbi:KTSC domain-containing protein [Fusobacterium ulcerans]|uniref:KTSC domain-containing protein n=1 Tax=Fusobacterium ulcerans 12-1B TaxID=457404 RepID=H1PNW2_9FUSO|nr:KTSC domain-containing protein [Fusobacterium ulcerans]EHO85181.1 hypothetical protein HMPREF0402_00105 [Fusobacterium ulcerans 12-1B]